MTCTLYISVPSQLRSFHTAINFPLIASKHTFAYVLPSIYESTTYTNRSSTDMSAMSSTTTLTSGMEFGTSNASVRPVSPQFRYYLPRLSTSDTDLYTTVCEDSKRADIAPWEDPIASRCYDFKWAEALAGSRNTLPFIRQNDFPYYPTSTQYSLVSENQSEGASLIRKKRWSELPGMLRNLSIKKKTYAQSRSGCPYPS
jgi:hypothetical protein